MHKIRIGMIGAGFMGGMHAQAAHESHIAKIVAVSDIKVDRAESLAAKYGGRTYTDYQKMLDQETLDAVVVTTPENDHCSPVVSAANKGCHIFVEKPLAVTLADADTMIAACEMAKVKLMVGFILRFESAYAKMKEALTSGMVGSLMSAYGRRNASRTEARRLSGRCSVINYLTVHDIDQILWFNDGHQVKKVTTKAIKGRIFEELGVADYSWTWLEFENGSLGVVESGWGITEKWSDWREPVEWKGFGNVQMHVIGSEGVMDLNFQPMNLYSVDSQDGWKFPDSRHWPTVNGRIGGAERAQILHFLECVLLNLEPLVNGKTSRRAVEICLASENSIAKNCAIDLLC